jgi:UDP-3-O-[3-hydroxymyristoyl] glucosamine N-acyltransferase
MILSVLNNAREGMITYYVGDNPEHVKHLTECILYCKKGFETRLTDCEIIEVEDPQLEFYKLSHEYKKDYLEEDRHIIGSYSIHPNAKVGKNVKIGTGCVIGNCIIEDGCIIHPNVVIYSNSVIGKNSIIEASSVIGATGVMWVWDDNKRVYLEQLGGVVIESNCYIGSNVTIVRGSANEFTVVGEGTCMAHGTLIGHGCQIGKQNHFANNVSLGGGCYTADKCFFSSGVVLSPGAKLKAEVLIGAGGVVIGTLTKSGVYIGIPAKWKKEIKGKLSGVPLQ